MDFKKVARLCRIAIAFPELADGCEKLILGNEKTVGSKELPSPNMVESARSYYESNSKLEAVKFWKRVYDCSLMDAKRQIEALADRHGWVNPNRY